MGLDRPLFPAPEAGLRVLTVATPGLATSAAGTAAVSFKMFPPLSSVAVVLSGFPFHCTTVWVTKPRPFTVSTKSALPALIWGCDAKYLLRVGPDEAGIRGTPPSPYPPLGEAALGHESRGSGNATSLTPGWG